MILLIDTSKNSFIKVKLKQGQRSVAEEVVEANRNQSEKLLDLVSLLLDKQDLKLSQIKGIEVVATGDSFTGLRVGVVTGNALAYSLNIPVSALDSSGNKRQDLLVSSKNIQLVSPEYSGEPNITKKK